MKRSHSINAVSGTTILALSLMLAGSGVVAAAEVATLRSPSPEQESGDEQPESESSDPMDTMLDFAACMRESGVDMPDPQSNGDGAFSMVIETDGEGAPGDPFQMDGPFMAAEEACRHFLGTGVSDFDPELEAEMMEGLLAFSECMRENGVDMPDPDFGSGGGMVIMDAVGEGVDPFSAEYEVAQAACRDLDPFGFDANFGGVAP